MPVLFNLMLVLLLISTAGVGGYLLARAHFTATIANRVMAYQARLARSQRDAKQAHKDVARLEHEVAVLAEDLTRSRERVGRYEAALFEGYPASDVDLQAAAAAVSEQSLQHQAQAYVERVQGVDDFNRAGDEEPSPVAQRHRLSRAIA